MKTESAKAAAAIKNDLAKAFPGVKFSVKSKNYSMGDRVNVNWTDGPTVEMVRPVVQKYEYGHFDGMNDIYEYSNTRTDIPQTKYLFTNRDISPEVRERIRTQLMEKFDLPEDFEEKWINSYDCWGSSMVHREFYKMAL